MEKKGGNRRRKKKRGNALMIACLKFWSIDRTRNRASNCQKNSSIICYVCCICAVDLAMEQFRVKATKAKETEWRKNAIYKCELRANWYGRIERQIKTLSRDLSLVGRIIKKKDRSKEKAGRKREEGRDRERSRFQKSKKTQLKPFRTDGIRWFTPFRMLASGIWVAITGQQKCESIRKGNNSTKEPNMSCRALACRTLTFPHPYDSNRLRQMANWFQRFFNEGYNSVNPTNSSLRRLSKNHNVSI